MLVWERRGCWEVHSVQFRSLPRSTVELIAADLGDDLVLVGESGSLEVVRRCGWRLGRASWLYVQEGRRRSGRVDLFGS